MKLIPLVLALAAGPCLAVFARDLMPRPEAEYFKPYEAVKAAETPGLYLKEGDRLAICGDSITEQKMYSRLIETYLTACVPQLQVTCRQFGWSGEKADGFAGRMKQDVLRFMPTVATTCYGMNDHRYVPYTDEIGEAYVKNQQETVQQFKEAGVRVVVGSPGTIGLVPGWVKSATGTKEDLNLSLLRLRNHDVRIAEEMGVRFADVFWPMLTAGYTAQEKYGKDYMLMGKDGVHPGWAGQTVMAYAFLKALGLDGEIGTLTWDTAAGTAMGSPGHEVLGAADGGVKFRSTRYPFCVPPGDVAKDDSMASAVALIPFHETLNRFKLVLTNATAARYEVTWGGAVKVFDKAALEQGINLAAEFPENPFAGAFDRVSKAVYAKQDYETRQIKTLFHGPEGAADIAMTAALTEKVRAPLAEAVAKAMVPVEHVLVVKALP
jgi:lysophospholipase L1-like esterase